MIEGISRAKLSYFSPPQAVRRRVATSYTNSLVQQTDQFVKFGSKDYFRQKNIDTSLDSTKISYGNPKTAKLIYRGYDIKELANFSNFGETAYLLLYGKLPKVSELQDFEASLVSKRELSKSTINILKQIVHEHPDAHPMYILQAGIVSLGLAKSNRQNQLTPFNLDSHQTNTLDLIAKAPTLIAYAYRLQNGQELIHPDPKLSHAANFLYMINGEVPEQKVAEIFEKTLICYMDHGFNASTLAARAAASTGSSFFSAINAGVSALSGRFHGGANEAVSEQLSQVLNGHEADIAAYIQQQDKRGEKIYGFGHKKYKSADPRVEVLTKLTDELAAYYRDQKGMPETDLRLMWKKTGTDFKHYMQNQFRRKLPANVDYPIGYLYPMLGIPIELNTPIFAMSRVVGWSSHVGELQQDNTVYSPYGAYEGEVGLEYPKTKTVVKPYS